MNSSTRELQYISNVFYDYFIFMILLTLTNVIDHSVSSLSHSINFIEQKMNECLFDWLTVSLRSRRRALIHLTSHYHTA